MDDKIEVFDLDNLPAWADEDTEDEKPVGPEDDPNTASEGE